MNIDSLLNIENISRWMIIAFVSILNIFHVAYIAIVFLRVRVLDRIIKTTWGPLIQLMLVVWLLFVSIGSIIITSIVLL